VSVAMDDFVRIVETVAPRSLAYEWDNSGLLLRLSDHVYSVLLTLDVTQATVDEAAELGCDMILTHHPTIFAPIKYLNYHQTTDALMISLVKAGISLYAAHTSYDRANGGMGDILSKQLGLYGIETVSDDGEDLMRTGFLPLPCGKDELADHIKTALGIRQLRISKTNCDTIHKLAVVGGSGGDFIAAAKKAGAKALITGEAKHHHFLEAAAQGVLLAEAGHFDTERYFVDAIFISLQSCLNEVQLSLDLKKSKCMQAPYEYV
jgi:dinuclear metal center YbgI/SA1388 family protein